MNQKVNVEGLDQEWVQLILEAKKLGLGKQDIQEFLTEMTMKEFKFHLG